MNNKEKSTLPAGKVLVKLVKFFLYNFYILYQTLLTGKVLQP